MELAEIARVMRAHAGGIDPRTLDVWLGESTVRRFQEWTPQPADGERRLLDLGCYAPTIGYYAALGWREIIGVAKEEGECNRGETHPMPDGVTARTLIHDIETEPLDLPDDSMDAVLMMEIFEHFGLDPMHALCEANRVLKPGGLLVFSTPNAAEVSAVRRILSGQAPHAGLEFSGFSTNRHNRLYDAQELEEILFAAGFAVEQCTSRTYVETRSRKQKLFETGCAWWDRWVSARNGRRIERGHQIFIRARKSGPPRERYPRVLYFDPADWPQWFAAIRGNGAKEASAESER